MESKSVSEFPIIFSESSISLKLSDMYPSIDISSFSFSVEIGLSKYGQQIKELQNSNWRGKKFRVFLFGDYDFYQKCRVLPELVVNIHVFYVK